MVIMMAICIWTHSQLQNILLEDRINVWSGPQQKEFLGDIGVSDLFALSKCAAVQRVEILQ